MSMTT